MTKVYSLFCVAIYSSILTSLYLLPLLSCAAYHGKRMERSGFYDSSSLQENTSAATRDAHRSIRAAMIDIISEVILGRAAKLAQPKPKPTNKPPNPKPANKPPNPKPTNKPPNPKPVNKPPNPKPPNKPSKPKSPPPPWIPGKKEEEALIRYLNSIDQDYSLAQYAFAKFEFAKGVGREVDEAEKEAADSSIGVYEESVQQTLGSRFSWWKDLTNLPLRREVKEWLASGNFSEEDNERKSQLGEELEEGYLKTAVCRYKETNCDCDATERKKCVLKLDPEIEEALQSSRDPEELKYYWTAWHNGVAKNVKASTYAEFIELSNEQARSAGFHGNVHQWASAYDTLQPSWTVAEFRKKIETLWNTVKPYYKILHAYVRMKLGQYPAYKGLVKRCGYIPLHLLKNVFGQTWIGVESISKPFPNAPSVDATQEMKKQGYTPRKMMETADKAFVGMGLKPVPPTFYEDSILEKSDGSSMQCHPMAWNMNIGKWGNDQRITMCSMVNQRDLATMHHELGHVQYMMQSEHLRINLRGSANPAFDESVGDVIAMAVNTPDHLQCILGFNLSIKGLCNKGNKNYAITETDINYLYAQALESFSFFPFSLVMDMYRYMIMEGKIKMADFNKKWWEMRRDIQGVKPPEPRPNDYFDAAAKYHVVAHGSYFRYFLSSVVQYQLYEGLCITAGQYNPKDKKGKPLYRCDFTGRPDAGKQFGQMLQFGKSKPWPDLLKTVTRKESDFSTEPLLRYFMPLFDKLKELLKKGKEDDCLNKEWASAEAAN